MVARMTATTTVNGGTPATKRRTKPAAAEALLPVSEVAELWRCSRQHIYNLISTGQLRSIQAGAARQAKTRIPESALAEFVARRSVKAKTGRKPRVAA
jgi:excisionase family DNA binding protein